MESNEPLDDFMSPSAPPKNWMTEAVLVTLCCCQPLGIVALIKSSEVNSKYNAGDYAGAEKSSADAKKFVMLGFFIGLPLVIIIIVIQVLAETM